MGYRLSYFFFRAVFRAAKDPAALAMLTGYIESAARRAPRCEDEGARTYLRAQQQLRRLPLRAREADRRIYGPTTQRRWAYADSKAMDEFLALAYAQERGLDCTIARLFNTVGPRQSAQYGMVIPTFAEHALAGRPIEIHGDGTQTRCFCHMSDTIRALKGLMEEPAASGEIFNVGSGNKISILELAERVRTLTGSESEIEFVPYDRVYGQGIEDMLHREPSIEKIREATGWQPERDLTAILTGVIEERRNMRAPEPVQQDAGGRPPLALPSRAR